MVFESLLDSISKIPSRDFPHEFKDIETLNSNYLIENIDLAFEAWYKYLKISGVILKRFVITFCLTATAMNSPSPEQGVNSCRIIIGYLIP